MHVQTQIQLQREMWIKTDTQIQTPIQIPCPYFLSPCDSHEHCSGLSTHLPVLASVSPWLKALSGRPSLLWPSTQHAGSARG